MEKRADFYILNTEQTESFAVKLIEKAFNNGLRLQVVAKDQQQAQALDHLLWTFKNTAFIPHAQNGDDIAANAPILIGTQAHYPPQDWPTPPDAIINLSDTLPESLGAINRLMEVIPGNPLAQQHARARYKMYRDRGFTLNTHKIGS